MTIRSICDKAVTMAAFAILSIQGLHASEAYPSRPIRLVVPYGAGGSLDMMARVLAAELGQSLHQQVIVENVPGAGGTLGARKVIDAPADGYTLLMGVTSEIALAPSSTASARYKADDLRAIAKIGTSGLVLIARPTLGADTLRQLIDVAHAHPGTLQYGTSGAGSLQHLAMETLKLRARADIPFVPYKSATQVVADIIGGHLDLGVVGLPAALPHIADGKVKALAVLSRSRDAGNKAIPAASELAALRDLDFNLWTGIFAPRNTPTPIIRKLNDSIARALRQPAVAEKYAKAGVEIAPPAAPEQFAKYVTEQERRLADAYRASGMQPQ